MGKILVGCGWGLLLLGAGIVLLPLLVVLVTSFSTPTASPELSLPWLNLLPITHHYPLPITYFFANCINEPSPHQTPYY
jgi:hypothetical protein